MGSDGWLFLTFVWVDVSILCFAGVLIVSRFPSRIRRAAKKNCQRLDGSISKRRKVIEQTQFVSLLSNTLAVIAAVLLLANITIFVVHKTLVPIGLAVDAFSIFQWDKEAWKAALSDPQHGNLAGKFPGLFELVATWPVVLAVGLVTFIATTISLGKLYISTLKNYEKDITDRYRDYFAYDMRSRHQTVESGNKPETNLDAR